MSFKTWDLCEPALKVGFESTKVWLLEVHGKGEGHDWWCNCKLKPRLQRMYCNVCSATRGVSIAFMKISRAFVVGGREEEVVDNRAHASLLKVHIICFCIYRGLCNKVKARVITGSQSRRYNVHA